MRLLYVTAEVPWPLTSGYLRHYHLIRGLAERHDIVHVSLTRRSAMAAGAREALEPYVERLEVVPTPRRGRGRLARHLAVRRAAVELRRRVAAELAGGDFDAVVLSGKDTFPALGALGDVPLVVDVCDAASLRLAGELAISHGLVRRTLLRARLAEMRHIERRLVRRTPHLLFASERDRDAVGAAAGTIVANGVDVAYWTREAPAAPEPVVAFSGAMAYRPNDDAARRLVRDLLPRVATEIPDVEAVLAGRDPLPALVDAAAASPQPVEVTGTVDDLRRPLERAAVFCAPLRFAAGIQNKLLEALAYELPVVTTPVAAAGLEIGGEPAPVVIADGDDELAAALVGLLRDPAERRRLALAGRAFVTSHFSWDAAVDRVDGVLRRAAPRHEAEPVAVATLTGRTQP